MVRVTALALGFSVLAVGTDANPLGRSKLVKRDMVADICGSSESQRIASDNHNAATWNLYNMGDWFKNMTKPWVVMNWNLYGIKATDIQTVVLYEAAKEGVSKCDEITDPNCSGTGWDYNLCKEAPQAHFVWFAITNWANYLNKMYEAMASSTISLTSLTSSLVEQFYTPQSDPTQLILPVSVASGLAAALSVAWPLAAIPAGAGSVINGALTQAALDRADPLVQWGQVQTAIGSAYTQIQKALEAYYKYTLDQLPDEQGGIVTYDADPSQLPMIFADGTFASVPQIGEFPPGFYGGLAASAINALWREDKDMIMKVTDAAYGKGDGAACKAFPTMTACIDGVAYIFIRWQMDGGTEITSSRLWTKDWNVWGAYKQGSDNDNHLSQYGLDLTAIAKSAQKTQDQHGFDFKNQNGATIEQLKNNPTDLDLADIMFFSLPICDIAAIIGPNKHLNGPGDETGDDPIVAWGACTCVQMEGWPTDKNDGYPDDPNGYVASDCRKHGWADN